MTLACAGCTFITTAQDGGASPDDYAAPEEALRRKALAIGLVPSTHNDTPVVPPDIMRLVWSSVARKGTIAPGKVADLVVLDRDPLTVAADDIAQIRIVQTLKNGRVIFKEPGGPARFAFPSRPDGPPVPSREPGWKKPTPRASQTVKALADQDIHRNAAVL